MITGLIVPGISVTPMEYKGPADVQTVLISEDVVWLSRTEFGVTETGSIRPDPLIRSV